MLYLWFPSMSRMGEMEKQTLHREGKVTTSSIFHKSEKLTCERQALFHDSSFEVRSCHFYVLTIDFINVTALHFVFSWKKVQIIILLECSEFLISDKWQSRNDKPRLNMDKNQSWLSCLLSYKHLGLIQPKDIVENQHRSIKSI